MLQRFHQNTEYNEERRGEDKLPSDTGGSEGGLSQELTPVSVIRVCISAKIFTRIRLGPHEISQRSKRR